MSSVRSVSPSARSTASTASVDTIRTLYGSALAAEFDASTLDELDADVLFAPANAFIDVCWTEALAGPSTPARALPARRSVWVHNGLGGSDDEAPSPTSSASDEDDADEDGFRPPSYATLDKIAPWAAPADVQRRGSVLAFRRPSGASTLFDIDPAAPRRGALSPSFMDFEHELAAPPYGSPTLAPLRPVRFAPLPEPEPASAKRRFAFGLRKRA